MMFQKGVFFEYKNTPVEFIKKSIQDGFDKVKETGIPSRNILVKILSAETPKEAKDLGKEVKYFNKAKWEAIVPKVLLRGNMLKFQQNPKLLEIFLNFKTQRFVEASPYDEIYGIGLAHSHPDASNPAKWRGQNILGNVLTQLRDYFLRVIFPDVFWFCPNCHKETLSNNNARWNGKNLHCTNCEQYNYYSDFRTSP